MTRPTPRERSIEWPKAPTTAPLWQLTPARDETRVVPCPGRTRPLELVADPFSS